MRAFAAIVVAHSLHVAIGNTQRLLQIDLTQRERCRFDSLQMAVVFRAIGLLLPSICRNGNRTHLVLDSLRIRAQRRRRLPLDESGLQKGEQERQRAPPGPMQFVLLRFN